MLSLEIPAAIFTLLSVWYATERNIWSWLVGICAVCLFAFIFYKTNLYANFTLQGIFFIQGIAGIIVWYHNREINEKNKYIKTKIEKLSNKERFVYITPVLILYLIVSYFLSKYTNSAIPYIDSLVATLSLFANYLLVRRKIESWWIWILVDVIYVGLFFSQGLYVSSVLYLVLLIFSIKGFINWNTTLKSYS